MNISHIKELLSIAQSGGEPFLIDTPEEVTAVGELSPAPDLALSVKWQVNFARFAGEPLVEAFGDVFPLDSQFVVGFIVLTYGDMPRLITLDEQAWKTIVAPLKGANSPEDERGLLKDVVASFEKEVRPEPNCRDKSFAVAQLLAALYYSGLLQYHYFDANGPYLGNAVRHRVARLVESSSNTPYFVDSWVKEGWNSPVRVGDERDFANFVGCRFPVKQPY